MQRKTHSVEEWLFGVGDYLGGAATGVAVAAAVHLAVSPGMDMVLAMLLGMILGMVVHVAVTVALSPVLGFFHLMAPCSLIGMYGGMSFAMRDAMQHPATSMARAALVGAVFGIAVVALVRLYDRALQPRRAAGGR